MRILFERTGGLMGLKSNLKIDLNELPAGQALTLRTLLDESNFFSLPENPAAQSTPDGFFYTITVESKTFSHTIKTSDSTAPEELQPLLQELSLMARRRPGS